MLAFFLLSIVSDVHLVNSFRSATKNTEVDMTPSVVDSYNYS